MENKVPVRGAVLELTITPADVNGDRKFSHGFDVINRALTRKFPSLGAIQWSRAGVTGGYTGVVLSFDYQEDYAFTFDDEGKAAMSASKWPKGLASVAFLPDPFRDAQLKQMSGLIGRMESEEGDATETSAVFFMDENLTKN